MEQNDLAAERVPPEPHRAEPRAAEHLAEQRRAFATALAGRDVASAVTAAYAEDARLLPPLIDVVEGRDEIAAFWQAGVDAGVSRIEEEAFDCTQVGGLAYELGRYTLAVDADSASVVEHGRYVTVHRLIDGRWQRALEMFTSDDASRQGPDSRTTGDRS